MTLPDVSVQFSNGNLGFTSGGNIDGVFAAIGACSLAPINQVQTIVDPSTISSVLGYGPLSELVAQILANSGNTVYAIPGNPQPGTIGAVAASRSTAPTFTATALLGIPDAFLAASSGNTGQGSVQFDSNSTPVLASTASFVSVQVTTAGGLGAAQATITIESNVYDNQQLNASPWVDPNQSGIVLDFSLPLSGTFAYGDSFTASATPTDGHNVVVTVQLISPQGMAQFTYSLDGGITVIGPISAPLGGAISTTGPNPPPLTIGGTAPEATHSVVLTCTASGVANGVGSQFGNTAGALFNAASSPSSATVSITIPTAGPVAVPVTLTISNDGGTAHGSATSANPNTGTGTAAGTLTIGANVYTMSSLPATFVDAPSGLTITLSGSFSSTDVFQNSGILTNSAQPPSGAAIAVDLASSVPDNHMMVVDSFTGSSLSDLSFTVTIDITIHTGQTLVDGQWSDPGDSGIVLDFSVLGGNFATTDSFSISCLSCATFKSKVDNTIITNGITIDGSAGSTFGQPSTEPVTNPLLYLGASPTNVYTYNSSSPSSTTSYTFTVSPAVHYQPREQDGSVVGLDFGFGFGTYLAGDQFSFLCTPPSVLPADALTALDAAISTTGVDFSMAQFACEPTTFAIAATLASDADSALTTLAESPTYRFISAVVFGPSLPSSTSGATPTDFINATNTSDFERVGMTCGTALLTSALTGRQLPRNAGYPIAARLAADAVQEDPGAVGDGALLNVTQDLTPLADATNFDANRGMTVRTFAGLTGTFCNQGLTLAGEMSDYGLLPLRRVIDKAARYGRLALLPRVNSLVRTVPGTGTILPADASSINAGTRGQILANCAGNFQDVTVAASLTANVLSTSTLPVTISVLPFAYTKYIPVTIGFTTA